MKTASERLAHSATLAGKAARLGTHRVQKAGERFAERMGAARTALFAAGLTNPLQVARASVDAVQRTILFWDALRQRGNGYLEHENAGSPPVLHFDYEMVMDGRKRERPVNYALVRIVPPEGVVVSADRRPYVVIDPRAGHGPGIGGMKDDSQVGVALRDGHPVYFVIFYPNPEPGQTLLDVRDAEREFIARVREMHPKSPKPALVGNCQGGWAAMMLASADPEDVGPIVINGAPMSYWGGAWSDGEGDNPMRYAGGSLGGTWLSSFSADLGDGIFDGAYLVDNFESLNPANTYWDKYRNLYANIDTEVPRYLDFERWWGGYYLMNREEIEWITQNLFVGNKLWKGGVNAGAGGSFDLRELRSPVILFASMGDNITPPQQAFNWVADVYGSTDEIKARGQVIVGLMHESIGHLGIFVSGKVAKKEYTQIVSVLKSIEALPPGLYAMKIVEEQGRGGKPGYTVEFEERRLEDVVAKLNRFERADEAPFAAAAAVSEFNQRAYELFARPLVQALANPLGAQVMRRMHPLRASRWSFSDLNPWLWWLKPVAASVKTQRMAVEGDDASRAVEAFNSELISASLDLYRDLRDAQGEALFFLTYGNLLHLASGAAAPPRDTSASVVHAALASMEEGGAPAALARCLCLLRRKNGTIALHALEARASLVKDYEEQLPRAEREQARRMLGTQELICEHDPARALATLPSLVPERAARMRLLALLERLVADPRVQAAKPTVAQREMLDRIRAVLTPRPRLVA